jgi:limonene-1,2-epoxide hydrolase
MGVLTPVEVVRSYLVSFASADPDRIAAHVADDFVNEHTSALGSGCVGRDAYLSRLPGFLTSMAGLVYDIESIVADGNEVMAAYTMRARFQGDKPIVVRGVQRFTVAEGFIAHRTDYWDSLVFLLQIDDTVRERLTGLM